MEEVHGAGATMDYMDLERERGITITSAATSVQWKDATINLIDTPGHVDFTVEVERSLRVLDGAILVLCAVGGVQAQSITIDRQMRRYRVPRLAFINKMDRAGADPYQVVRHLRERLDCDALLLQIPIGTEADFEGVVDLVAERALYFDGPNGEIVRAEGIPDRLTGEAHRARQTMLEALAMYSDEVLELLLSEEPVPDALLHRVIRLAVLQQQLTPVFLGAAYRNKGVQPLLDAVIRYLPSPLDCSVTALAHGGSHTVQLSPEREEPTVAMAFKIVEDPFGVLTFLRIYQGKVVRGGTYYNQRTGHKERFSRILRMHADQREEIPSACAGDIVAVLGAECTSGDTYCSQPACCTLERMFVPEPVIRMAVRPRQRDGADRLSKALQRFRREDPTLRVTADEETGETLMAGMGELHLEVYAERIRREFGVEIEIGQPKVAYRESPTTAAEFNVRHRKQTGGAGQYAHIIGRMLVLPDDQPETFLFEDRVTGGRIPRQFMPAIEKGFRQGIQKGSLAGYPIVRLHVIVEDGSYHEQDSSELAFLICAQAAMREAFPKTRPVLLEPVMKIEIECPSQFQGAVVGDLTARRGAITATEDRGALARIEGEVPLAETFGYSTALRSMTQGQGTFTMEFTRYGRLPPAIERDVIAKRK